MAHGIPRGRITTQFEARVFDLETKARKQSEQFRNNNGPRPWHTPIDMENKNLLDVPNLHEPSWNRDEANQIYAQDVLTADKDKVGTAGDIAGMKKQIVFMATEERAWRLRHASAIRCAALAHGRLAGHGEANVGVFSMVKNVVDNHIQAGNDSTGRSGDGQISGEGQMVV
jgi:hypothetical protein